MRAIFIISIFTALCVSFALSPALAQKKEANQEPATHMWVKTGTSSMSFVPVRTVGDCDTLIKQAASLNSSEGKCYNGPDLVKTLNCVKPVKAGREANCS